MSIRTRILAIAGAATLALTLGTAVPALAGGTPGPDVSPTDVSPTDGGSIAPNFGYNPSPGPVRLQNWQFDVQRSSLGTTLVNRVDGQGAIPMIAWLNSQNGPFRDTFALGPNSVTIRHNALSFPVENLQTCSLTFDQVSPFRIVAGTGTAAGAISRNGLLTLTGLVSYPYVQVRKHNYKNNLVCPLRFVSLFVILNAIRNNLPVPGLPAPTFTDFAIQGQALVSVQPAVIPTPYPTKTRYTVAPVTS